MSAAPGRDPRRLLLADDDEIFRDLLARALARQGFAVSAAATVAEGRALAEARRFDCAVVDLRMGESSGLELVQVLHERDPDTRILVLTGYASIATAVEAIKLGATHYLTKPAEVEEIVAALDRDPAGDPSVPPAAQPLSVRRLEWEHLQKVLMEHDGNISAAARALGMHRRTLQRKLKKRPVRS